MNCRGEHCSPAKPSCPILPAFLGKLRFLPAGDHWSPLRLSGKCLHKFTTSPDTRISPKKKAGKCPLSDNSSKKQRDAKTASQENPFVLAATPRPQKHFTRRILLCDFNDYNYSTHQPFVKRLNDLCENQQHEQKRRDRQRRHDYHDDGVHLFVFAVVALARGNKP